MTNHQNIMPFATRVISPPYPCLQVPLRALNHSCDPNLRVRLVYEDNCWHAAFEAIADIPTGTEVRVLMRAGSLTHTHTLTHTHSLSHTHIVFHAQVCSHSHRNTHKHLNTHLHRHTHTLSHTMLVHSLPSLTHPFAFISRSLNPFPSTVGVRLQTRHQRPR